jgi:NAD(P) transhydrogenase subunit beta
LSFEDIRNLVYLLAAVLFIFGLKGLTHPRTAVRGNLLGALGMFLAVVVTLLDRQVIGWAGIAIGILVGTAIGVIAAVRVKMTAMPQLIALLNGFGGAGSALVAGAELHKFIYKAQVTGAADLNAQFHLAILAENQSPTQVLLAIALSGLIGAVTFTGSVLAYAKLQELISSNPITAVAIKIINSVLALICIAIAVALFRSPGDAWLYWALVVVASLLGIGLVAPIGGADMPVVISLLNSYSGIAAAATGFVINNIALIITGALVGASGIILTRIMCVAMNRSLTNVLFGVMADAGKAPKADDVYAGRIKSAGPEELAILFDGVRRVMIVPGYGMAVSQAQHAVRDLMKLLESRGAQVEFAIHPVAGRMPGHMNVLLAEADVPYDKLKEMDEANASIDQVDVAIIIGANDVVNPAARTDPRSPIAGMPIIDVDRARTVVMIKRSLSPGFAGIPNMLFAADNCLMYFADGQKAVLDLVAAIKAL